MGLFEALETRRSCRAFLSTPAPRGIIERILRTDGRSLSFANSQPWEVALVSGEK